MVKKQTKNNPTRETRPAHLGSLHEVLERPRLVSSEQRLAGCHGGGNGNLTVVDLRRQIATGLEHIRIGQIKHGAAVAAVHDGGEAHAARERLHQHVEEIVIHNHTGSLRQEVSRPTHLLHHRWHLVVQRHQRLVLAVRLIRIRGSVLGRGAVARVVNEERVTLGSAINEPLDTNENTNTRQQTTLKP